MYIALATTAIIIVVIVLHLRLEKIMGLNFTRVNAALTVLEQNANPGETSADQAQLDQVAGRVEAVNTRFAAPAAPAPSDTPTPTESGTPDSNAGSDPATPSGQDATPSA